MNRPGYRFLWMTLIVAGGFWSAAFLLGQTFPPPNTDEVFIVAHGKALMHGQGSRYALYDDVFAPSVYAMRDAFGQISETLTNAWYGVWPRRAASATAIALGMSMLALWGYRWGGQHLGQWVLIFLLLNPLVWCAACLIRPEALFLMASASVLYLVYYLPQAWPWRSVTLGVLSGSLLSIHPNALAVAPGILAAHIAKKPSYKRFLAAMSGLCAAGLAVLLIPGLSRLYLVQHSLAVQLLRPWIAQRPLTFQAFIQAMEGKIWMTQTLFLPNDLQPLWETILKLRMGATLLLWGMLAVRWGKSAGSFKQSLRPLLWGLGVSWCLMVIGIANHEVLYPLYLEPFTALIFAAVWMTPGHPVSIGWSLSKGVIALLWLSSAGLFVHLMGRSRSETPSLPSLTVALKQNQPFPQARVLAPNFFWTAWEPDHFRDVGALNYSYFYTGGSRDVRNWLQPWRPDMIVLDEATCHVLLQDQPALALLQKFLQPARVQDKGILETHLPTLGTLHIFWVEWPHGEK